MTDTHNDEVNTPTGLINESLHTVPNFRFVPKNLVNVVASGKNLTYLGFPFDRMITGGISFSHESSTKAAIGEYVERLLSSVICPSELMNCSEIELKNNNNSFVPSSHFSLFSEKQYQTKEFKFQKIAPDTSIQWSKARNLITKEEFYVPAFAMHLMTEDSLKYGMMASTGFAAGPTIEAATIGAFLEVLERDAFMKFWYLQKIDHCTLYSAEMILREYGSNNQISELFENSAVDIYIFDLGKYSQVEVTLTYISYVLKGKKRFSVGAAARFSKIEAIIKSTLEAYQGVGLSEIDQTPWPKSFEEGKYLVTDFERHLFYYNIYLEARENVPLFRILNNPSAHFSNKIANHNKKLDNFLIDKLKMTGFNEIYFKDFSRPELTGENVFVAKVCVPSCIPLTSDFNAPFIGSKYFDNKELFTELPHFFP